MINLNLTPENASTLAFLTPTVQDEIEFISNFWKGEARQFFAVSAYRLHKIRQRNMSDIELDRLYVSTGIKALEELFQQPIDVVTANVILNKITNGSLTIKSIYDRFIAEDGRLNIARIATAR